jgi:hypothetical protein
MSAPIVVPFNFEPARTVKTLSANYTVPQGKYIYLNSADKFIRMVNFGNNPASGSLSSFVEPLFIDNFSAEHFIKNYRVEIRYTRNANLGNRAYFVLVNYGCTSYFADAVTGTAAGVVGHSIWIRLLTESGFGYPVSSSTANPEGAGFKATGDANYANRNLSEYRHGFARIATIAILTGAATSTFSTTCLGNVVMQNAGASAWFSSGTVFSSPISGELTFSEYNSIS